MKLSKQQVLDLYNGLNNVSGLSGSKFAYAVARNLNKLKREIGSIQDIYPQASNEFKTYEQERSNILKEKDEAIRDKKLKNLEDRSKKLVKKRKEEMDEFNKLLLDEVEVDLHLIDSGYLPDEITAHHINGILLVIKEDE